MAAVARCGLSCRGQMLISYRFSFYFYDQQRSYAKKAIGQAKKKVAPMPVVEKKFLEPETDPQKLAKYLCGGNILKEGSDPELKPDSEYPEWLWTLRTDRGAVPLEDLDKDSWQYWRRIRKDNIKADNQRKKNMYRYKDFK